MPWRRRWIKKRSNATAKLIIFPAFLAVFAFTTWGVTLFLNPQEQGSKTSNRRDALRALVGKDFAVKAWQEEAVKDHLRVLPLTVQNAIADVKVWSACPQFTICQLAHCHVNGVICIRPSTLARSPESLWHEGGHARFDYLERVKSDFWGKWTPIKGGILTPFYDDRLPKEIIADYVDHVYRAYTGRRKSAFDSLRNLPSDSPYHQRLLLLYKYGFISWEAYIFIVRKISI